MRKIIHIFLDAFYASIEQRDNPALKGIPIAIATNDEQSIICEASYEARAFGVKTSMLTSKARILCPEIIFIHPRIEHYRSASKLIHSIFKRVTDDIESLSLFEAYLDVTENKINQASAQKIAEYIRETIKKELGLTVSAGVSYNKFLAIMASGKNRPNGISIIPPSQGLEYIYKMPIETFYGIGKDTAQKFKSYGIHTGADLAKKDKLWLTHNFGKNGVFYFSISRGMDNRPVNPNNQICSITSEQTIIEETEGMRNIFTHLEQIFNNAHNQLLVSLEMPKTIVLKIKYDDFSEVIRTKTMDGASSDIKILKNNLISICNPEDLFNKKIRLISVAFSNFPCDILPIQSNNKDLAIV